MNTSKIFATVALGAASSITFLLSDHLKTLFAENESAATVTLACASIILGYVIARMERR